MLASGSLSDIPQIIGSLSEIPSISGTISKPEIISPYTGSYDVTPKAHNDQVLETANKTLTNNITIHKIPFVQSHNDSGTTVYIAKEIDYNG